MRWEKATAQRGDIVRVALGPIYHYGIFVSEEEVIQFGLPPTLGRDSSTVEVLSASVTDFLAGGVLEVGTVEEADGLTRRPPEETVQAAKNRLGERGYDILHNNCEHFANECAFGKKFSCMTEELRNRFRTVPLVHVYVAKFPFPVEREEILPKERAEEIEGCSNAGVRSQKYYSWKLLESALERSLGLSMDKLNFTRTESGKWECDGCHFSLSHSGSLVCVAVSRKRIGVDIEKLDEGRFTEALTAKIATVCEKSTLDALEEGARGRTLNALWTKKEAIFKQSEERYFHPERIETSEHKTVTRAVECADGTYLISVASEDAERASFRLAEGLTIK